MGGKRRAWTRTANTFLREHREEGKLGGKVGKVRHDKSKRSRKWYKRKKLHERRDPEGWGRGFASEQFGLLIKQWWGGAGFEYPVLVWGTGGWVCKRHSGVDLEKKLQGQGSK